MFFSIKQPVKIAGKTYIPCICYPVTELIKRNIDKLVEEGKAVIYTERVFFQNGKVIEKPVIKPTVKTVSKKTEKKTDKKVEESEGF